MTRRLAPILIPAVIVAAIAGFLTGRYSAQERASNVCARRGEARFTDLPASRSSPLLSETHPLPEDTAAVKQEILFLRAEVRRLQAHADLPKPDLDPRAARLAKARRIWKAVGSLRQEEPESMGPEFVRALAELPDLDSDLTVFFIDQFRGTENPGARECALQLICVCGGPEADAFLRVFLVDSSLSEYERGRVLDVLGANDLEGIAAMAGRPIAVSDELARVLERFLSSSDESHRASAARILGRNGSVETMNRLRQLAVADPDVMPRVAAILALGKNGNAGVLAWLRTYPLPREGEGRSTLEAYLMEAIERLSKKVDN